jgi:hypothetical protein
VTDEGERIRNGGGREWIGRSGWKKERETGKRVKKKNEKIGKGNLDFLQPQSNRWSRFAKRFPKRLQLHQKSRSIKEVGAVFGGARALPNSFLF